MGFCTMYLIFISQNMSIYLSGISVKEIVVLTLPILVLLCWIGSLKLLAPTSVLALSLLFFGLFYVLQEAAPNLQDATTIKVTPPQTYTSSISSNEHIVSYYAQKSSKPPGNLLLRPGT